jgi:cell division protein FtsA
MFDESNIIVGLEVGTSKICAVVGEQNADGTLNIIGIGQFVTSGVDKGEIVDAAQAEECVRNAIVQAETMADVEIRSVYLGVTGGHLRGLNSRGKHIVYSAEREISDDDVQDVIKNAKAINLPAENTVVHAIRQHFSVDGHDGIKSPVGMLGARLEVDMHVVHGNTNRLQNSVRLVKGLQFEVDDVVFNGLASSLALLTNEQKELGALVIDIGGGTTDYVLYAGGVIKHTGALALGGNHVSNDLGYGLKVSLSRAEKLKLEHGSALVDEAMRGRTLTLSNEIGLPMKTINVEHLQRIMSLRLEEIFQIIAADLEQAGMTDYPRAGAFLCGGCARIPQIAKLAAPILQMHVSLGQTNSIGGIKSTLDQPEFVGAIGLVKYGSLKTRKREGKPSIAQGIKDVFGKLLQRP